MPLFEGIEQFKNVSPVVQWAIFIVGALIAVVAAFSLCVSIYLMIKYIKFNRRQNSIKKSGGEVARTLLDKNGLKNIKVSTWGSFLFGNSYSHYFHKVRLRRLTKDKDSVTSLAMAAQKTSLAVMDKQGDPDMKARVRMTPFIYFGPAMFIPIVAVGIAIDFILYNFTGVATIISAAVGLLLYVISFVMSIKVLVTEKKAQKMAVEMLKKENMATGEELDLMDELFRLYNIEYINDIILAFLEMVLRVLSIIANVQNGNMQVGNNSNN